MSDFRPVLRIIGFLLLVLGAAMLALGVLDLAAAGASWEAYLGSSAVTVFTGGLLALGNVGPSRRLSVRQGFLLTTFSWVVVSAFAALPLLLSDLDLSYTDAFFEAISGLTTTGSTVLVRLDAMPHDILLWRAVLQWLGGIGIIAMAIVMLPMLRVGGMQLFQMESSDRSERILPRPAQIATAIGATYLVLTLACALAYWLAGMTGFEAVAHAMTTISTGGYSTSDASIGHFTHPAVPWIASLFMIAGALPFVLYVRVVRGAPKSLWRDSQARAFLGITGVLVALMALWLLATSDLPTVAALGLAAMNVTSIITTTGYVSADYNLWGSFPVATFFFVTFLGGCTGSTAGALKTFRIQIGWMLVRRQMRRLASPHEVRLLRYNDRPLTEEVIRSVMGFFFLYLACVAALTLALAWTGLDWITSASGAATAISNVGPGLGTVIGPAGNFSSLPDAAKWLLSLGMLLGRLELFTVLVLFAPRFWRD